jgi:alanine racemase
MIYLDDLSLASGGQLFGEKAAEHFGDFCYDWRLVQPGQLYIALSDPSGYDGHTFIENAIIGGASGVLCTHPPTNLDIAGTTVVVVPDTAAALSAWAGHVLAKNNTTIVGVAGTMGKSSAKGAVAAALATRYSVYKAPQPFNGELGLALGLGGLSSEHQIAVLELSCDRSGEIADILALAPPHVAVLTNAFVDQGEGQHDSSRVLQELEQIINALPGNGGLVLNYDDDDVRQLGFNARANSLTYGLDVGGRGFGADLLAYNIQVLPDKLGFDLRYAEERLAERRIPLLGRAQLYAALAGLGVGILFEVPLETGARALTPLQSPPGRMALLEGLNGSLLVDDSFDASPTSVAAALNYLEALGEGQRRRIFVLGDMRVPSETADANAVHREIGERAHAACDLFITRGRLAASAGLAALQVGMPGKQARMVYSHGDAARAVQNVVASGDIVVVSGSRVAAMEHVTQQLLADPERDSVLLPRRTPTWVETSAVRPGVTSWIELDLDSLAYNIQQLKARVGPNVDLMSIVKANGYGHGILEVASTAINNGAIMLGVDNINEGITLREAGIGVPILVLTYTPVWAAREAILNDLTLAVYDIDIARECNRIAADADRTAKVHVKVDTGMGRLGLLPDQVPLFFRELTKYDHLEAEGIFTHCSVADSLRGMAYTQSQLARFSGVLDALRAAGITFRYVHAANSAATLSLPESHFNMVRVGLATYGLSPSEEIPCPSDFGPVLTWKTSVGQVKTLPPGSFVGYGNTYQTTGTEKIAVLRVGYADGFRRAPRNWNEVLIHGQRVRLVGRISMGMATANVTHLPDVRVGDEVVLIGQQGDEVITAEDVARRLDTINYEVVTSIPPHVPRII